MKPEIPKLLSAVPAPAGNDPIAKHHERMDRARGFVQVVGRRPDDAAAAPLPAQPDLRRAAAASLDGSWHACIDQGAAMSRMFEELHRDQVACARYGKVTLIHFEDPVTQSAWRAWLAVRRVTASGDPQPDPAPADAPRGLTRAGRGTVADPPMMPHEDDAAGRALGIVHDEAVAWVEGE